MKSDQQDTGIAWLLVLPLVVVLVLTALVPGSRLAAQQTEATDATEATEEPDSLPYDPAVLRRQQFHRGPYNDLNPQFTIESVRDDDVEVDAMDACRPPNCNVDQSTVLVKLAPAQSPGQLRAAADEPAWSVASDLLDKAQLLPVFDGVSVERLKKASRSATPENNAPFRERQPDLTRWYRMAVPTDYTPELAIEELRKDGRVEVAEPIYERKTAQTTPSPVLPNDPKLAEQWHLDTAGVKSAWQWLSDNGYEPWGDPGLVVAVIDSGVDYNHEDLRANMWVNPGEIPDNGLDDDGNGFVDDVHGVTVVGDQWSHSGDPADDNGHGTHVAGIIAASPDNNVGVVGVAPNVKIMAVKAAQYSGILTSTDIAEAIFYAYEQGADVINMSFGGTGRSLLEEEALAVAFGNAVLVASAGNDGLQNQPCYRAPFRTIYPAAYTYVLGVMAQSHTQNKYGDWLAGFSNWDCKKDNGLEYELMAPGVDVLSTFPGNGYAAWDGTSMSAPVVSGLAALTRTRFSDRSVYSSRFIMGQVASTGAALQAKTPCLDCLPISARSADGLEALVNTPRPSLNFQEFWLWDTPAISANNDDDGSVDAGETVELAVVIKNRWGQANNVQVTLSAEAGAAGPDPYVSWDIPSVNYGSTGSFATDDNGLLFDDGGLVTGVNLPFRMTVSPDTPNNHLIVVTVTMTANNGLDPTDTASYTTRGKFELIVRRGRELPSIIGSDAAGTDGGAIDTDGVEDGVVTLDDSTLWIVDKPVLIERGVEVRFTEGADVQFWADKPDDAYAVYRDAYIQNEGTLTIQGSVDRPVRMSPSDLFPDKAVVLLNRTSDTSISIENSFSADYWWVSNLIAEGLGKQSVRHALIDKPLLGSSICRASCQGNYYPSDIVSLGGANIEKSRLRKLAREVEGWGVDNPYPDYFKWYAGSAASYREVLFDAVALRDLYGSVGESVFLKGTQSWESWDGKITAGSNFIRNNGQDWQVIHPQVRDGKTYVLLRAYSGVQVSEVEFAQAFAKSLNGNLLVINDDAEGQWTGDWLRSVTELTTADWTASYPFCAVNGESDNWCTENFNWFNTVIGYQRQPDGSYAWVDNEVSSSNYPAGQYYWDQPGAGADYPPKASYLVVNAYTSGNGPQVNYDVRYESPYAQAVAVELPTEVNLEALRSALADFRTTYAFNDSTNNAILNVWHDLDPEHWLRLFSPTGRDASGRWKPRASFAGNYWGGAGEALIDIAIEDFNDDFNRIPLDYEPALTEAPETTYPFVVDVQFLDADGNVRPGDRFAAEQMRWRVTFNRDMDTATQPNVSFGPDIPFTDFPVVGDWLDARTWEGSVFVSPVATDGYQYARIQGAVAADDAWLVTGDDSERFRFEVITSGTESLNLQATGGEGYVDLGWTQNDYDTLLGFNIYRSTDPEQGFIRINQVLVSNGERSYRDDSVDPGVEYYYYFTVMLDGSESDPSNTATATPIDTVAPTLVHSPVGSASYGGAVLIQAEVTDNIAVQSVTLYYRPVGATDYLSVAMVNAAGNTYKASIPGAAVLPPGVEYYVAASDGSSNTFSGRDSNPNVISVPDAPVVTAVSPTSGSVSGGELITLTGNNFRTGAKVYMGDAACSNVTVVSALRITCTTPAYLPESVAVAVENTNGGVGRLPNAFTFIGNSTTLSLPDVKGATGQTIEVPLSVGSVYGLASFFTSVSWNTQHLEFVGVRKGPLIPGWSLNSANPSAGTLNLAASSSSNLAGTGTLAILEFTVLANSTATSSLTLNEARFNDGAITVTLTNGSFTYAEGYTVEGSVSYWSDSNTPVAAVLSMDGSATVATNAVGGYSFSGVGIGQHTVSAAKDDGLNDAIRALDASLILSHVVGSQPLYGRALLAADVNANGTVTEQDAAKVLEVAAGLRALPFANQSSPWRFDPAERTVTMTDGNVVGQDFTGIFIGDVSGNWPQQNLRQARGVLANIDQPFTLVLDTTDNRAAQVSVYLDTGAAGPISAIELVLGLSADSALSEVTLAQATRNWSQPVVTGTPRRPQITIYTDVSNGVSGNTKLFTMSFSIAGGDAAVTDVGGWINELSFSAPIALSLVQWRDTDGDGVGDFDDAFPNDPAASLDTDGDGMPDRWNEGYAAEDSTTGLVLDLDDDGDGFSDVEEEAAGTDPADSGDTPDQVRMNMAIIKTIVDAAEAKKREAKSEEP